MLPSSCRNVHTQEKPSSGSRWISLIGDRARAGRSWHRFKSDLPGSGYSRKHGCDNNLKRETMIWSKMSDWNEDDGRLSTGKCKQQRTSAYRTSHLEKRRGETTRPFQGSRGSQPCKLWVAANWMAISGGGPRWSTRIDYDAGFFSKLSCWCLFAQSDSWLADIAPYSHPRSAVKDPHSRNPRISLFGPRTRLTSSGASKRL